MSTKGGPKKPQGLGARTEMRLHPYEELRLKQCMQNSARLQQLGLCQNSVYPNASAIFQQMNNTDQRNREDSESEYDPLQDETAEGDSISSDCFGKGSNKSCRKTKNQISDASSCGLKFRARKRVFPDQQPTTCTKSKKRIVQLDTSLPPSDLHVPPPSHPNVTETIETVANIEDHTQPPARDDVADDVLQSHSHSHMAHKDAAAKAIPRSDGQSNMVNEDGFDLHEDDTTIADGNTQRTHAGPKEACNRVNMGHGLQRLRRSRRGIDDTTIADGDTQRTHAGPEEPRNRGVNMGHGLQRINRSRRGKLPIIIPEGHIRPLSPIIAAKFATECNIAVRNHVPVLKHWKDYKRRPAVIDVFLDAFVQSSTSTQMMLQLKMEACQKNKDNRAMVKFPATTGSCSYPVFVENLGGEYEDKELDAFDLFKVCHLSKKKKCYTPNVQLAISVEGEEPMSATEVVADVLHHNTKKNMFLQNVGILTARPRSSIQNV